jgi:hypothetical protein
MHRILATLLALFLAATGAPRSAACQSPAGAAVTPTATPSWSIGAVSVQFGAAGLGLGELNQSLTAGGRPEFSENTATLGLSGYARFGRFVIGGGGETALPQRNNVGGWVTKVAFGSATVDAGAVLIDAPHFMLYPELSLGVRGSLLRLQKNEDFSYDDAVRDPERSVNLSSVGVIAGAGIVAEARFSAPTLGEFSIGLRAGSTQPLGRPGVRSGESSITGAPREGNGWYTRLTISRPVAMRRDIMGAISTSLLSLLTIGN